MAQRIKKDDIVKIISGDDKGTTGKVLAVNPAQQTALVEGVGLRHRHVKPSQLNPRGGYWRRHNGNRHFVVGRYGLFRLRPRGRR